MSRFHPFVVHDKHGRPMVVACPFVAMENPATGGASLHLAVEDYVDMGDGARGAGALEIPIKETVADVANLVDARSLG